MKDWFQKLNKQYKALIHIVLAIIVWVIIPCSSNDNTPDFLYLLWIVLIAIEIVLIVWSVKIKKSEHASNGEQSIIKSSIITEKIEIKPTETISISTTSCEHKSLSKNNENVLKEIPVVGSFSIVSVCV